MGATARLLVAMSVASAFLYLSLWLHWPGAVLTIAAKGAGLGFLAIAAVSGARGPDGWLLAFVMALGAAGDVLIEISLAAGAAAFAGGHLVAILLYRRNRRADADQKDIAIAALILIAAAAGPALLLHGRPEAVPFTGYALLLGAMAASAWLSRFPRRLVALGALLFLASDMLIALRMAGAASPVLGLAIWLLYYFGQLLIFLGVTRHLPPRGRSSGGGGPAKLVEG